MPRRIPDYPDAYAGWNYVASIGSLISLMSVLILIWVFYSMCYHNENKPNLKNNVWQTETYYSLAYNFIANYFNSSDSNEELLLKSRTNNSSLEFSIATPADYHSFTQAPIMGSLPIVGFASWAIMSIASLLTYIVIGGGLGNVYTESGCTLNQGLIFTYVGSAIRTSAWLALGGGTLRYLTPGLPFVPRTVLAGGIILTTSAGLMTEGYFQHRHNQQLLITNKSNADMELEKFKLNSKQNRTSSWFGFNRSNNRPPTPPTMGSTLPFGLGFVLPEHWVNALSSFNDYSSNEVYYQYIFNWLCVISDLILFIAVLVLEIYVLILIYKYIVILLNYSLEFKYPKLTKFINKYISTIYNANANFLLIIGMVVLIWASYKSQQFHRELLNDFTSHMLIAKPPTSTGVGVSPTFPFSFTLPDHWSMVIDGSNNFNYASFELYLQYQLISLAVSADCIFILTAITFFIFMTKFIFNKSNLNKILGIQFPKLAKFINNYLVIFVNLLWIIGMVVLIWVSYKSQQFHLELLKDFAHLSKQA